MTFHIVEVQLNPWITVTPPILPDGPTFGEVLQALRKELAKQIDMSMVRAQLLGESPLWAPNEQIAAGEALSKYVTHINIVRSLSVTDGSQVVVDTPRYIGIPGTTIHYKSGWSSLMGGPSPGDWIIKGQLVHGPNNTVYKFEARIDLTVGVLKQSATAEASDSTADGVSASTMHTAAAGHGHDHDHDHDHSNHKFSDLVKDGYPAQTLVKDATEYTRKNSNETPLVRVDQASLTAAQQQLFRDAVTWLIEEGTYAKLVEIHKDGVHRMHGSVGIAGLYRFLAWHRRFTLEFERGLLRYQMSQGTKQADLLGVPYWRLNETFPAWLDGFQPVVDPANPPPPRAKAPAPLVPTQADVKHIMEQWAAQLPNEPVNDYVRFTYGLEGWGLRADKSSLPAHNHRHAWVGGHMDIVRFSPCDPAFWLLHAEIDRLWHVWQGKNPGLAPPLAAMDRVMDPWSDKYSDLTDIAQLGYTYNSATY